MVVFGICFYWKNLQSTYPGGRNGLWGNGYQSHSPSLFAPCVDARWSAGCLPHHHAFLASAMFFPFYHSETVSQNKPSFPKLCQLRYFIQATGTKTNTPGMRINTPGHRVKVNATDREENSEARTDRWTVGSLTKISQVLPDITIQNVMSKVKGGQGP